MYSAGVVRFWLVRLGRLGTCFQKIDAWSYITVACVCESSD